MNEALRPMNLGEILDRTISLYRSRFLVFLGISAIPAGVILVVASGAFLCFAWLGSGFRIPNSQMDVSVTAGIFAAAAVALALPLLLAANALSAAAMTDSVNRACFGEKTTIRAAYKAIWNRGWRYIGLYLLQALVVWGVPIGAWLGVILLSVFVERVLGGPFAFGGAASGALVGLVTILGFVVLGVYAFWMLLRLSLAFPACMVEQIPAWAALKRSSVLSKGTRWRVLALYMLTAALTWILSFGLVFLVVIVMALIPGNSNPQRAQTMATIVAFIYYGAGFALQALTRPVYGIALVLFYYDQRIRKEGFDIEWMMQRAGLVAPAAEVVPAQPLTVASGQDAVAVASSPLATATEPTEETK